MLNLVRNKASPGMQNIVVKRVFYCPAIDVVLQLREKTV